MQMPTKYTQSGSSAGAPVGNGGKRSIDLHLQGYKPTTTSTSAIGLNHQEMDACIIADGRISQDIKGSGCS
jgi:hypothetical protein